MDGKTPRRVAYSRKSSRHTGKNSSQQDLDSPSSIVVSETENIAISKNLIASSSTGTKLILHKPSRLLPTVDHQKPLSSQVNQSLSQKSSIAERINESVKANVPKCTSELLETSGTKTMHRTARFRELQSFTEDTDSATHQHLIKDRQQMRSKPRCGSLLAPTISFTQRLMASRDAKKATEKSSRGAVAETKNCKLKNNSSSILKAIPSISSQSTSVSSRRDAMAKTKSFSASSDGKLAGPLNTRRSTSITSVDSRTTNKSKINDPLEHPKREITKGRQARGNPISSLSESVVASTSFSRSLDNDSFSGRKNFSRRFASGRPTSCPRQGRIHNLYYYSGNIVAHSLNHYDQHREMRMDIDSMSYEELLELQEKMGSVSTGLTDEALAKCLKRSNFKLAPSPSGIAVFLDGSGCSVCQEECEDGDEIGTLACEHWFHVACIEQWLRLKNWCPICKASACLHFS